MAVVTMTRRTINLYNTNSIFALNVDTDILNAIRAYNPMIEVGPNNNMTTYTFMLTAAQDTTLQGLMSGWAARLGLTQLDTHSVVVSQGHP